jgi:hypothetical protein
MGANVTIAFQGVEETISRLTQIEEKAEQNLVKQTKALADDGVQAWRQGSPRDTGRMQSEENAEASGLSISFRSPTRYYDWVNDGHQTPAGWRTRRGFRRARHRRRVEGQHMTQKLTDFVAQNATRYIGKFLDNV